MPASKRKLDKLWQVSLEIPLESEDAVIELFIRLFGSDVCPSAWQLHESTRTRVSFYTAKLRKTPVAIKALIRGELKKLAELGLDVSAPRISVRQIKKEDWAESWKRHFKVLTFDKKLMIAPSWSKRKAAKGMVRLVLDPGLSFGTGHHPTTSYCLSQIVKYMPAEGEKRSMLDIGCGTGILSIAAARLGYKPVFGFDNDAEAVENSIKNATVNQTEKLAEFKAMGVEKMNTRKKDLWDIVCANLEAPLLMQVAERIAAKVAPKGKLIVAGILTHQFKAVSETYKKYGFKVTDSWTGGEWTSGTLERA